MSIKIKSLAVDKISEKSLEKGYLYKDIAFDLQPAFSYNSQLNKKEYLKDVQALYDVVSVKNSIRNAFLTAPGQKVLNPTFGVDLRRFLFEPVDVFTEEIIQDTIENMLPRAEPRIEVINVTVVGDPEGQQYDITLEIDVPSLNIRGLSLKSSLNSSGYSII